MMHINLNQKYIGQHPRAGDLMNKKKSKDWLSPEEEGELRGLQTHPDNPEAAMLLQKEYLESQKMYQMTPDEKNRFCQIRADIYAKTQKSIFNIIEREEPDKPTKPKKLNGKPHLDVLVNQSKIASLSEDWDRNPKNIIDEMLEKLPDNVVVYNKDTLVYIPKSEPTPLELFLVSKLSNLDEFEDIKREDGSLRVLDSILCLRDTVRTKKFLMGIKESLQKLEGKEQIYVCDAGCGAIPIMAIYSALSSEKVHGTCIELNPYSAQIAKQIIQSFGLQNRIKVIEADATKFIPDEKIDLLISETMHSGLTKEMMVQIMSGLSPHVAENGIKLPSKVTVQASIIPVLDYAIPQGYTKIHEAQHSFFTTDWQTVVQYQPWSPLEEISFELHTDKLKEGNYLVVVNSTVEIGSQNLNSYDSLITTPQIILAEGGDSEISDGLVPEILSIKGSERKPIKVKYKPSDSLAGAIQK